MVGSGVSRVGINVGKNVGHDVSGEAVGLYTPARVTLRHFLLSSH